MNLQEANLRSIKVNSDDPLYLSAHSNNSLSSFVAAPGATKSTVNRTEGEVGGNFGRLIDEEVGESSSDPRCRQTEEGEIEEEAIAHGATRGVNV